MKKRSIKVGQKLLKGFNTEFDGNKVYLFFTVPKVENGFACVSMISEYKLEIFANDCKRFSIKKSEWDALGGPKLYPSDIDAEEDIKLISEFNQKTFKTPKERWDQYLITRRNLKAYSYPAVKKRINDKLDTYRKQYQQYLKLKEEERIRKIYAEIGIELENLVSQNKIKSLPAFRKKINNDIPLDKNLEEALIDLKRNLQIVRFGVYDNLIEDFVNDSELITIKEDLKKIYLDKINTQIKIHNGKLESELTKAILNKEPDKIEKVFNDFVEYQVPEARINEIIKSFNLENAVLSITITDKFKDYFINFALSNFPFFTVYNENATVEFKFTNGKIKSSTGHILNYNLSNIEKKVLIPYIITGVSPKFEPFEIKKVVKLVNLDKLFIHGKKDGQTIYYHEINQKNKEQLTFNGGEYSSSKLVFSKKNSSNSKSIKTKSFESLKELIRENLSDTYRFKEVKNSQNYNVIVSENLNSLFRASVAGMPKEGFLSTDKNFVNVYSKWIYELSINDKKINEQVKTKFNSKSGFKNINSILFNKPFYTIDVYRLY